MYFISTIFSMNSYLTTPDLEQQQQKKTELNNGNRKHLQKNCADLTGCWHVEECK